MQEKLGIAAQDAEIEQSIAAEKSGSNFGVVYGSPSNSSKKSSGFGPDYQKSSSNKELPEGMIYGRTAKIKGTPIKITDISPDTENVVITGEAIRVDSNDMRSKPDKSILIFDVYDGTSTITCKAFVDKAKLKDYIKKIDGKGIKIDGVARYDNFAKERSEDVV